MRTAFLAILVSWLVMASAQAQPAARPDYVLGPGDRIAISVLEDPGLNTTVLIRPDGRFTMPLAGTIAAEGRTPEAVQAAIQRALAREFISPPTVTVSVIDVLDTPDVNPVVYVIGQVGRPGVFEITDDRQLDILQALALAGGAGPFAATSRIQVRRREATGQEVVLLFNYNAIERGQTPSPPIRLRDGDVVVVPERGLFE